MNQTPGSTHSHSRKSYSKYNNKICDNKMTFEECELAILRNAVDENEKVQKQIVADSDEIRGVFAILEKFIVQKKLVLYGGLALNRLMPKHDQFYNEELDIPDYDMFSDNPLANAKELADIYHKAGYTEVEAKSGVHYGTFKVFVNFIGVADITYMPTGIIAKLRKEAVIINGIRYSPPNYLRMAMYLEMSRPAGDITRWEKIYKRLTLLNKYYPLKSPFDCSKIDFHNKSKSSESKSSESKSSESADIESKSSESADIESKSSESVDIETKSSESADIESKSSKSSKRLHEKGRGHRGTVGSLVRDSFIDQGVVFFGGYASSLYSRYMPEHQQQLIDKIPNFDVLSTDPDLCATIIEDVLTESGVKHVKRVLHAAIGELVPEHIQIVVDKHTIAVIYQTIACHSYNVLRIDGRDVNIATIDTMLSFYLAFLYADQPYYAIDRILCLASFLFEVQDQNRLMQNGLLRRFNMLCYGKQSQLSDMRAEKVEKFKELANKRGTDEYDMWFLKYNPAIKYKRYQPIHFKAPATYKAPQAATYKAPQAATYKAPQHLRHHAHQPPYAKKTRKHKKRVNRYKGVIEPKFKF